MTKHISRMISLVITLAILAALFSVSSVNAASKSVAALDISAAASVAGGKTISDMISDTEGGFLIFDLPNPGDSTVFAYSAYNFTCELKAERSYTVSYDMMSDNGNISVALDYGTGKETVWKKASGVNIMTHISFDYIPTADHSSWRFYCNTRGNYGTVLIDNIKITDRTNGDKVIFEDDFTCLREDISLSKTSIWHPGNIAENDSGQRGYVQFESVEFTNNFSYSALNIPNCKDKTEYTVTFVAKTNNTKIYIGIDSIKNAVWKKLSGNGWQTVSVDYTVDNKDGSFRIYTNPQNIIGYTLIDDIEVRNKATGELVYSDNFEKILPSLSGHAKWYKHDCDGKHEYSGRCSYECSKCGEIRKAPHLFIDWNSDENKHYVSCFYCGVIEPDSTAPHNYDHAYDTTCNDCGYVRFVDGVCGDVNGDGNIDGLDLIELARFNLHLVSQEDIVMKNADIDGNTVSDGLDLIAYAKYNLRLSSSDELPNRDDAVDPEPEPTVIPEEKFFPQTKDISTGAEHEKITEWFLSKVEDMSLIHANINGTSVSRGLVKDSVNKVTDAFGNTVVTAKYTHTSSNVQFTLKGMVYADSPSIDYVVNAKNIGTSVSPAISDFYIIDDTFNVNGTTFTLNTNKGSWQENYQNSDGSSEDFAPIRKTLTTDFSGTVFASNHGTSSVQFFPFYDIIGNGQGLIMAIGWSGDWTSSFRKAGENSVAIRARQQNLNTVLLPGEEIRTPSFVMTYFEGDEEYGHNVWRKLILDHYTPDNDEENKFVSPISLSVGGETPVSELKKAVDAAVKAQINADIFWIDAGWYDSIDHSEGSGDAWHRHLGVWTENKQFYPNGINEIFAYVHENSGMKTMLWWMIEDARYPYKDKWTLGEENYYKGDNVGAYAWVLALDRDSTFNTILNYFKDYIENRNLDCIRLDKSTTLATAWSIEDIARAATEAPGKSRRGITENKYIVNFYKLWDTLIETYPDFMLDNTCSGGRRIDIELMKRSIPLWRTDSNQQLETEQAHTQYLAKWLPLTGIGCASNASKYWVRSYYSSSTTISLYKSHAFDPSLVDVTKSVYDEFALLRPYWYGSYYQILSPDRAKDNWQAYELYRDDWHKGVLVAIRRNCPTVQQHLKLKGLDAKTNYLVHNIDDTECIYDFIRSGSDLMTNGIDITINNAKSINVYFISDISR